MVERDVACFRADPAPGCGAWHRLGADDRNAARGTPCHRRGEGTRDERAPRCDRLVRAGSLERILGPTLKCAARSLQEAGVMRSAMTCALLWSVAFAATVGGDGDEFEFVGRIPVLLCDVDPLGRLPITIGIERTERHRLDQLDRSVVITLDRQRA